MKRMIRYSHTGLLCMLMLLTCVTAMSQVTVDVKIDSLDRLVGEQAKITLEVTVQADDKVQLPQYRIGQALAYDLELLEIDGTDTTQLNEGKRMTLKQVYTITSFADSTRIYQLPPFVVKVNDQEYESNQLNIRYATIDVDTTQLDVFFPPKTIVEPALTWDDWKPVMRLLAIMALLQAVAGYLLYRYLTGKPVVSLHLRRKPKLLPHQVALEQIGKLKAEKRWADEDSKEYYTMLTDTLRTYISERYGFSAMEMTSAEIIERLTREADEKQMDELRQLFTTADLVKFARMQPMINENDMNLVNAVEFIQNTKVEPDPNAVPAPDPVDVEAERNKLHRKLLETVIIVLGVIAGLFMVWAAIVAFELLR